VYVVLHSIWNGLSGSIVGKGGIVMVGNGTVGVGVTVLVGVGVLVKVGVTVIVGVGVVVGVGVAVTVGVGVAEGVLVRVGVGVLVGVGVSVLVGVGVNVLVGVGVPVTITGSTLELLFCGSGVVRTTKSCALLSVSSPLPKSLSAPVIILSTVEEVFAFLSRLFPFPGLARAVPSLSFALPNPTLSTTVVPASL
jgi:hypothetical protein